MVRELRAFDEMQQLISRNKCFQLTSCKPHLKGEEVPHQRHLEPTPWLPSVSVIAGQSVVGRIGSVGHDVLDPKAAHRIGGLIGRRGVHATGSSDAEIVGFGTGLAERPADVVPASVLGELASRYAAPPAKNR